MAATSLSIRYHTMVSVSPTVYLFPTICRSASLLAFKRPITSHSKFLSQFILSCLFSQLKHSLLWDCWTWLSYMRGTSSAVHLCSSPFTKWLAIWAPRCALGSVRRMGKSQYLISNLPQPNVFRNLFHENPIWLYSSDNRFSRNGYGTVQTWDVTKYTKVATCCTIPISIQRVWGKYSQNALDKKCQRYVCLFKIESENSHRIPSNELK